MPGHGAGPRRTEPQQLKTLPAARCRAQRTPVRTPGSHSYVGTIVIAGRCEQRSAGGAVAGPVPSSRLAQRGHELVPGGEHGAVSARGSVLGDLLLTGPATRRSSTTTDPDPARGKGAGEYRRSSPRQPTSSPSLRRAWRLRLLGIVTRPSGPQRHHATTLPIPPTAAPEHVHRGAVASRLDLLTELPHGPDPGLGDHQTPVPPRRDACPLMGSASA